MSKATFPDKLRTQMRMALPMIDKNIRCKANTSRQSLMQASGLNDNQLQAALKLAYGSKGVPSSRLPFSHRRQDVRFRVAAEDAGEMVRDVGLCHRGLSRRCTRCCTIRRNRAGCSCRASPTRWIAIAANNRRTDIELFQVCKALDEPNVPTLLSLRDDGLPAYKAGAWRIDCRSFRKWATSYTPYRPQTETTNHYV